jgi:hypothetical protein
MHTISLIKTPMFDVEIDGIRAGVGDVLRNWHLWDRLGLVIDEPLGGLGASHLVQIAITSFYDAAERRRGQLTVYPEIYAFHVGRGWGSHAAFDFWPARREVILSDDPCDLLDAINDRGITRLVLPDRLAGTPQFHPKEFETALDRLAAAFVYDPSGRVRNGDVKITGNHLSTEVNPHRVLHPVYLDRPKALAKPFKEADSAYVNWLKLRAADVTDRQRAIAIDRRGAIRVDGLVSETYRRVSAVEALRMIAAGGSGSTDVGLGRPG